MDKLLGRTRHRFSGGVPLAAAMIGSFALIPLVGARAVTFSTMNGAPVQMQPYVDEPGAPTITVPVGTPQPFAGLGGSGAAGAGGSGGGGSPAGSSEALATMYGASWGAVVGANAQSMGLNPSVLAMTCVIESGCDASRNNGSYTGAFQLGAAAFHDGLNTALAVNPALTSQVVQRPNGINDPVTAGIAASGYLLQGARALEAAGVSNPTGVDVRAYYNFTPQIGVQIAQADGASLMSKYLPPSYMAGNSIPAAMTVGQWRDAVALKAGTAAYQPVRMS